MEKHMFVVGVPRVMPQRSIHAYVREAIRSWRGQYRPGHPLFDVKDKDISVQPIRDFNPGLEVIAVLRRELVKAINKTPGADVVGRALLDHMDSVIKDIKRK